MCQVDLGVVYKKQGETGAIVALTSEGGWRSASKWVALRRAIGTHLVIVDTAGERGARRATPTSWTSSSSSTRGTGNFRRSSRRCGSGVSGKAGLNRKLSPTATSSGFSGLYTTPASIMFLSLFGMTRNLFTKSPESRAEGSAAQSASYR
jgi:hypothetical protein